MFNTFHLKDNNLQIFQNPKNIGNKNKGAVNTLGGKSMSNELFSIISIINLVKL